jgi:hypothetical protein
MASLRPFIAVVVFLCSGYSAGAQENIGYGTIDGFQPNISVYASSTGSQAGSAPLYAYALCDATTAGQYVSDTVTVFPDTSGTVFPALPQGFSGLNFSMQTALTANPPSTQVSTVSVSSSVPAGNYEVPLLGNGSLSMGQPEGCYRDGITNDAYSGYFPISVLAVANTPVRNSFTQFTLSGSPPNASDPDIGWTGSATWNIGFQVWIGVNQAQGLPSCYGKAFGGPPVKYNNCPAAAVSPSWQIGGSVAFKLAAPEKPGGAGKFVPGIWGQGAWSLGYSNPANPGISQGWGPTTAGNFAVATAGLTEYKTSNEEVWGYPPNCGGYGFPAPVGYVSGSTTAQAWFGGTDTLITGTFCRTFLADWWLQGSAILRNPANPNYVGHIYKYNFIPHTDHAGTPTHEANDVLTGNLGCALQADQTLARDLEVIPGTRCPPGHPFSVSGLPEMTLVATTLSGANSEYNYQSVYPTDTGGAFRLPIKSVPPNQQNNFYFGTNHFDMYTGQEIIKPNDDGWPNPMVLFGCSTPVPPPPKLLLGKQFQPATLCPAVDDPLTNPFPNLLTQFLHSVDGTRAYGSGPNYSHTMRPLATPLLHTKLTEHLLSGLRN